MRRSRSLKPRCRRLNKQLHQARDQLAVLTGRLPADFTPARFTLEQLTLPMDLPLGVPSQLVERRPDVRAAEAQLHAATAQVGVAIANLLPQLTITGNIGSTATQFSDLFKAGTGFWSLGANATQTLFAGGALIHRKRAADAALDQAAAQYRAAVLDGFSKRRGCPARARQRRGRALRRKPCRGRRAKEPGTSRVISWSSAPSAILRCSIRSKPTSKPWCRWPRRGAIATPIRPRCFTRWEAPSRRPEPHPRPVELSEDY